MKRSLVLLALVAITATACAGGGDGGTGGGGGGGGGGGQTTGTGSLLPEDRLALPTFDPDRFQQLLAQLQGTPVLVNVWAAWCPPCRLEAPHLADAARKFEGRIQFVGVDILDNRGAARDFILEFDWQYPSVFDPQAAIRDDLGGLGQPVTIIYDAQGEKSFHWNGAVTGTQLEEEIEKVI